MKLTNEVCIVFLKASGWLDNHDIEVRNSGVRLFADRLLEYDKPITKDDILDELMFFKESNNELPNNTND